MAEDYSLAAQMRKKKQAEALAKPAPTPTPTPTPTPAATPSPAASPSPKPVYKGTFDRGGVNTDTSSTKSQRSDKNTNVNETATERSSTTSATDSKKKAERFKTLSDDEIRQKAIDGDFEARFEADSRKIKYKD